MALTLPPLTYAYDALQPYMSRETLEYHHDKHHKAYVDTANNLLKDSPLADKPFWRKSSKTHTGRIPRYSTMRPGL